MRTTYVVLVEHETGEEPILSVSEGARIVSVAFSGTRDTAPGGCTPDDHNSPRCTCPTSPGVTDSTENTGTVTP